MKLLLYCVKAKPYLFNQNIYEFYESKYITSTHKFHEKQDYLLNGKIVAECDFEVENIYVNNNVIMGTETLNSYDLVVKSKVEIEQMRNYLKGNNGYAIHIKNLHIFDKPIDIRNYYNIAPRTMQDCMNQRTLVKAPQNMCNAYDVYKNHYIVISIQPQWLCKILNKEKTIEIRKKVLKEMIK